MSINSKQKGARFERELAAYFRARGYDARRSAQYCGNTGVAPDVIGLPELWIEAKHQERMHLYDWIEQAVGDASIAGDGKPVVMHKQNGKDVLVTMLLDDWVELYEAWNYFDSSRREITRENSK